MRSENEEGVEDEEADTDLETDRLLGQQRTDDHGFYDDKLVRIFFILPLKVECDQMWNKLF